MAGPAGSRKRFEHPLEDTSAASGDRAHAARYTDSDDLLAALTDLPTVACHYGYPDEARSGAEELYTRTIKRYGPDNLFATEAIAQRARVLQMTDHAREAIPLYEEAVVGLHKYVGEQSPNVAAVL